ncbi:MAG: hypothetical protein IKX30_14465, partial [Victivallales bacterium]|nr:hypothetical protein [Victivallales bacterium]
MIKEQVISLLKKSMSRMDWKYQYDEDDQDFMLSWHAKYFFSSIKIHICVFDKYLTIISRSDTYVQKNISRVAEYLTRINYGMATGALEMDCNDGDFRFYLRMTFAEIEAFSREGKNAALALLTCTIMRALIVYDVSATGFYTVMLGMESPKKAAKKAQALIDKNGWISNDNDDVDDDDDDDDDIVDVSTDGDSLEKLVNDLNDDLETEEQLKALED